MKVPLGWGSISEAQINLVVQTLREHRTSRSQFTDRLERMISEIHGVRRAVFMASGTCALHLALEARKIQMGWPDGAVVIVPATTFVASVQAVRLAGLTPVLCDVNREDYNLHAGSAWDTVKLSKAVAVMPVHLLGRACDMGQFVELSERLGVDLIEDCCESFGVQYSGKPVGSFGAAGAISTYVSHHLSTGTGGAVITNDNCLAEKVLSLMQHGIGDRPYRFDEWGYSFRSTEMEAALGVGAMAELDSHQDQRLAVASRIQNALGLFPDKLVAPAWIPDDIPMFYPVECVSPSDRDPLREKFESAGIETRPMLPLVTQPRIRQMLHGQGKSPGDYPVSLSLTKTCFMIGCHPGITIEHVEHIGKTVESYFK